MQIHSTYMPVSTKKKEMGNLINTVLLWRSEVFFWICLQKVKGQGPQNLLLFLGREGEEWCYLSRSVNVCIPGIKICHFQPCVGFHALQNQMTHQV